MNQRLATCLLLIDVLAADGMIREEERALLDATMERVGLTAAERKKVADIEGMDEAIALVASLDAEAKSAIMDELTAAALSDGQLSPQEIQTIGRITAAIGL
jgi:uncharacterized tellurite resistance protein B-like protein